MAWQFSSGEILTATNLNAVTIPWNAICQVRMASPQSIASGSLVTLNFDAESLDPRGWHDPVTNNSRITPTIAGWYEVVVVATFGSDTDYTRMTLNLQKSGAALVPPRYVDVAAPGGTVAPGIGLAGCLVDMDGSTNYLTVQARQTNTSAAANPCDALFMVRLVYPT